MMDLKSSKGPTNATAALHPASDGVDEDAAPNREIYVRPRLWKAFKGYCVGLDKPMKHVLDVVLTDFLAGRGIVVPPPPVGNQAGEPTVSSPKAPAKKAAKKRGAK